MSSCVVKMEERGACVSESISTDDKTVEITGIESKGVTIFDRVESSSKAPRSVSPEPV